MKSRAAEIFLVVVGLPCCEFSVSVSYEIKTTCYEKIVNNIINKISSFQFKKSN